MYNNRRIQKYPTKSRIQEAIIDYLKNPEDKILILCEVFNNFYDILDT